MAVRKRKIAGLTAEEAASLRTLVAAPKFELIPLSNAAERIDELPHAAAVTVTASPSHGIESTLELAEQVAERGHGVIPHLSAHMIRDRAHLGEVLDRCREGGFTRVFVVGGDAKDKGEFHDGLIAAPRDRRAGHPFTEIGVPSYPEGHVDIADERLLEVLLEKQRYAHYMATQMCFNPGAIVRWIARMRAEGVTIAVHLGTPGVAELTKLMTISGADRRRRFRPLPEEEPQDGRLAPHPGQVRPRRAAARDGRRLLRPGGSRRGAPSVHVQPRGGHARVAAADARRAGVAFPAGSAS